MTEEARTSGLDALFAEYTRGRTPEPVRVLIASHLELSPANRAWVQALEALGGTGLEAVEPVPVENRDIMLARAMAEAGGQPQAVRRQAVAAPRSGGARLPEPLRRYLGMPLDQVPWQGTTPGLREYHIPNPEGLEVSLISLETGRAFPRHTHGEFELLLVLEGSYTDETGRYMRGDIHWSDHTLEHSPIADPGGDCVCFLILDAPLQFTDA